jgi:hypothetical protein
MYVRRLFTLLLFVPVIASFANMDYGINVPLGSESDSVIDPALVGRWVCVQSEPGEVTRLNLLVLKFNEHAYYGAFTPGLRDRKGMKNSCTDCILHYRMFISVVDGHSFLNYQSIGLGDNRIYVFDGYAYDHNGDLVLRVVNMNIFKKGISSISEARKIVSRRLHTDTVYSKAPAVCHRGK